MSRSLSRFQAIILGFVVLAGLVLGGWALFQVGSRQGLWAETYELRAGFTDVGGVEKGTPVHVRGIEAGQVVGVDLPSPDEPNGKVYLRIRLDKRFQPLLCADAKARISNEGVFGSHRINIETGKDTSRRLQDGDEIAVAEAPQLTDLMAQASQTLQEIRESNGTIAKLMKSDEAHKEVVELVKDTQAMVKRGEETFRQTQDAIREGKDTLNAVKQDADAIKRLPVIRNYVEDTVAILHRPDMDRDRRCFATEHLFEPGKAILSDQGKQHLSNLAPWFAANRVKGSDIVVVSYAAPPPTSDYSSAMVQNLTQKQSEAVANYLRENVRAERISWYSSRKITPIGMGTNPPLLPETEPMSPGRTEIQIFLPR
ncbi:MAG TPA: MlaD family protein [Gemmataceae bacterium]|jgi:outer membrane protein OmpA-like peptidoglycan-associated protein|nr:MlaD family protein [Gemmataceae bacterium]